MRLHVRELFCPGLGTDGLSHRAAAPTSAHFHVYQSDGVTVLLKTHPQSHWRKQ